MPTTKPRITITLTEHQHEVLGRMATLGKGSMSAIVVDLLETMIPVLERVVHAMQVAADAPKEMHKGIIETFERAEQDMLPLYTEAMQQLDKVMPAPGSGARMSTVTAPASRKPRPPASNRGVRKSSTSSNSALKSKASTRLATKGK